MSADKTYGLNGSPGGVPPRLWMSSNFHTTKNVSLSGLITDYEAQWHRLASCAFSKWISELVSGWVKAGSSILRSDVVAWWAYMINIDQHLVPFYSPSSCVLFLSGSGWSWSACRLSSFSSLQCSKQWCKCSLSAPGFPSLHLTIGWLIHSLSVTSSVTREQTQMFLFNGFGQHTHFLNKTVRHMTNIL